MSRFIYWLARDIAYEITRDKNRGRYRQNGGIIIKNHQHNSVGFTPVQTSIPEKKKKRICYKNDLIHILKCFAISILASAIGATLIATDIFPPEACAVIMGIISEAFSIAILFYGYPAYDMKQGEEHLRNKLTNIRFLCSFISIVAVILMLLLADNKGDFLTSVAAFIVSIPLVIAFYSLFFNDSLKI